MMSALHPSDFTLWLSESSSLKSPSFQFYPSDFMSDPKVAAMSHEERGVYIALLCYAWMDEGLPGNIDEIADLVREPRFRFAKAWAKVGKCFTLEDGRYVQKRQELVRKQYAQFRESQSRKGKISATLRHDLREKSATPVEPDTQLSVELRLVPEGNSPTPTPSLTRDTANAVLGKRDTANAVSPRDPDGSPDPVKNSRVRLAIEPGPIFAADLERDVVAFLAVVAAANKSGTIAESRIATLRREINQHVTALGDEAVAYGLREATSRGVETLGYAIACAKNYKPSDKMTVTSLLSRGFSHDEVGGPTNDPNDMPWVEDLIADGEA